MDTHLFGFTSFKNSLLNSSDKYLKSLSDKFVTDQSKLEFINCILSIKTKFLLIVKAMYFSNPFGLTVFFTLNLLFSFIIKWLSKPLRL